MALTELQHFFVQHALGLYDIVTDHSWGITDTVVLHVKNDLGEYIVKAFGPDNHHFERELLAYQSASPTLANQDRASFLRAFDDESRVLIFDILPGEISENTPRHLCPELHAEAGRLLRMLHDVRAHEDSNACQKEHQRALSWLDGDHPLSSAAARECQRVLQAFEPELITAVPTHGDYQPRNWLLAPDGVLRIIDFGRFALRGRMEDFMFLEAKVWRKHRNLELAFMKGYGKDPRAGNEQGWFIARLRAAIGIAAWAHQVGLPDFSQLGVAWVNELLETGHP